MKSTFNVAANDGAPAEAGRIPVKMTRVSDGAKTTAFFRESQKNPEHVAPTAENVTIRSPREAKEIVARVANDTLQAAIRAGDWKSAQASADVVSQMCRWLQLSDEQITQNT